MSSPPSAVDSAEISITGNANELEQDAPDFVVVFEDLDSTSPLPGFELGQISGIEFSRRLAEASEDDVPFRVEDLEALFLDEEVLDEEDFSELLQR